jgi:phenylacetate-CoA ligase
MNVRMIKAADSNSLANGRPQRSPLQRFLSGVLRRTAYPVIQKRSWPGAGSLLKVFQSFEFASASAVENRQRGLIVQLLRHASERVPYYQEAFAVANVDPTRFDFERDFSRIPILNKSILRERRSDLVANEVNAALLIKNASGGSTGKPVEFFQDVHYWAHSRASRLFIQGWWGIQPGDAMASVWGADRDIPQWTWREKLYQALNQQKICNAFLMSEERMEKFARELQTWQPPFINGYSTALEMFSQFLLARPQYKIRPLAVESSAETLTDAQRSVIERAFEAPLYNFYGSREVNNLAAECPAHEGLHVNSITRFIEIVDDEGNPQPTGVPGRVLVTDLTNYVMPFIRYENEDVASWAERPCNCGRPFPLLERVWGRSSDFITTPSGKLIHGEFFTHLFYPLPQVRTFQVAQQSLGEIKVSVALHPGEKNFSTESLQQQLNNALGPDAKCTIEIVDTIPRTLNGKHRFTISSVPARWNAVMAEKD